MAVLEEDGRVVAVAVLVPVFDGVPLEDGVLLAVPEGEEVSLIDGVHELDRDGEALTVGVGVLEAVRLLVGVPLLETVRVVVGESVQVRLAPAEEVNIVK